jgi:phage-related protein
MCPAGKRLVWLHGEIKTPPFSKAARLQAGYLLRRLQEGERLFMPHSRPTTTIGSRCNELRILDSAGNWRIIYRLDTDAIIIAAIFAKKTQETPSDVIVISRERFRRYDNE